MKKIPGTLQEGGACFQTTHWTAVMHGAKSDASVSAQEALAEFCKSYWPPLYTFVRRRGHSPSDAQDLVQGFFAHLLSQKTLSRADRDKGRLRTFLLGSLQHFLANEYDRRQTLKRGGASLDAAVLVLGETGTGKELIACELHRRSRRGDKRLIRVNCACIPKDLFESEFFGHARGAFTGAVKDRGGRFEAADGGTLFLDEVGEIPLELQSKLLRVLQEKSYERTGDTKTRTADVRIVAATNRNLQEEVAASRFREDLYYRLNVVPIKLPPLRDRKEDIPLLASHFIEITVKEIMCPKPRLTRAGIDQLQNYDWPGNIRELCNAIQQAAILAQGGDLDFNLPADGRKMKMNYRRSVDHPDFGAGYLTEAEMQQRKRENLLIVLKKTGWKVKGIDGAAELLGVKPTTLISQIQRLGLKRSA